jgi:NAD(P)H-nitrite reductase large subunit
MFENRLLRRVFGPKRDEVTGEWRKLHEEELSDLYSLPNIVQVVKSCGGGERCAQGSGGDT